MDHGKDSSLKVLVNVSFSRVEFFKSMVQALALYVLASLLQERLNFKNLLIS